MIRNSKSPEHGGTTGSRIFIHFSEQTEGNVGRLSRPRKSDSGSILGRRLFALICSLRLISFCSECRPGGDSVGPDVGEDFTRREGDVLFTTR